MRLQVREGLELVRHDLLRALLDLVDGHRTRTVAIGGLAQQAVAYALRGQAALEGGLVPARAVARKVDEHPAARGDGSSQLLHGRQDGRLGGLTIAQHRDARIRYAHRPRDAAGADDVRGDAFQGRDLWRSVIGHAHDEGAAGGGLRLRHKDGVVRGFLQHGVEPGRHVLLGLEVVGTVPGSRLHSHVHHSSCAVCRRARSMSRCCVDLSHPHSSTVTTAPRSTQQTW